MQTDKDFHFSETYSASVLSFTDNAVSNIVFDFLKSVSHMITFLKHTLGLSLRIRYAYVNRIVRMLFI